MTSSSDQKPPVDRTGHALTSGVWMGAGYGLQGLMTVGSVAVLARVLSPAEFGLVSAAMLAINFSDRKSTRLNSSHSSISYAVFCLKKKKRKRSSPPQGVGCYLSGD